ncbi:hypothetical protein FE782_11880 [Paenibacillus antri]|uniref:WD40 repeat domain-containing protein n=1 Tax=Paenibacillus antri TaxID=2582848 RepID=A0A5R9GD93_9BACL|nr:hypothetical protein [Paenibacillus antri]TLS52060.1 hypothetical protein FE782_11880 [Paenibacillus antri]
MEADETRTAAVCIHPEGEARIVVAARGYVVIVDPASETSRQLYFPEKYKEYPYACIAGAEGAFYIGAGRMFMAIDPFEGKYTDALTPDCGEEIVGFRLAEASDGSVYLTTYPRCLLLRYDPAERTIETVARLDETQKYAGSIACGRDGWVYAGIGTERRDVVAVRPATGERRSFVPAEERTRGAGRVVASLDGRVFGSWSEGEEGEPLWHELSNGEFARIEGAPPPSAYAGEGFRTVHGALPAPWDVESVDLAEREVVVANRENGKRKTIRLHYRSDGANVSPLTLGPDGRVWGTSNHPLQLFAFDPDAGKTTNYGGRAIELGGGGNLCAYASAGTILAGAAYAGGHLHLIDTAKPLQWEEPSARNPKLVASHREVHRPRCALAHSDGAHIVYGGFPDYGFVGGGLCVYDLRTGEDALLTHDRLVPDQSTLCLAEAEGGRLLIGGTSIETPGGAEPKAKEAALYAMDWATRTVVERWTPIPGAREISLLKAYTSHRVIGITSDALLFTFDVRTGETLRTLDLSAWGKVVRDGLAAADDGLFVVAVSGAVCVIEPVALELFKALQPPVPVTAGLAYRGGRAYFASGSELCSIHVRKL